MDMVEKALPDVPVIVSLGNNDLLHHYQTPDATEKAMYYGDLFDIIFENHGPNSKYY
jgi:hypothetical protein